MNRFRTDGDPLIYRLDGRKIKSPSDFYREIGSSVNGEGGYFGRNLDALADCLRGGFGTPVKQRYEFEWLHSAISRRYLSRVYLKAIQDVFTGAGITLRLR